MLKRRWLLAALPLALAACAGDEAPEAEMMEETGMEETAPPQMGPAMDTATAGMAGMATTVTMSPLGDSGVEGEVVLTPAGEQTEANVTLSGLEANSTHPGHIHQGTCDAPGSVVVALPEITADASGSGTATATVAVAPDAWMAGGHIVAYHGEGGAPIVCGEIEAHAM